MEQSELGPTGGLETDTQPVVSLAPAIHPPKLESVPSSTVRSDKSRTKVGRKSQKSELGPTGGHETVGYQIVTDTTCVHCVSV